MNFMGIRGGGHVNQTAPVEHEAKTQTQSTPQNHPAPQQHSGKHNPFAMAKQMGSRLSFNLRDRFKSNQNAASSNAPATQMTDAQRAEFAREGRRIASDGMGQTLANPAAQNKLVEQLGSEENRGELQASASKNGDLRRGFAALGAFEHKPGVKLNAHETALANDVDTLRNKVVGQGKDGEPVTFGQLGAPHTFDRLNFNDPNLQKNVQSALNDYAQLHQNTKNPNYVGQPQAQQGPSERHEIPQSLRPGHSPQAQTTGLQRRQHVQPRRPEAHRQEGAPPATGQNGLDPQLQALKQQADALGNYQQAFKPMTKPPAGGKSELDPQLQALKQQADALGNYRQAFKPVTNPPAA